jgi:hypothetical protein
MRRAALSLLILFAICDQIVSEDGFFTVVGSNLFRLGKSYRVSIAYQGYESEKILEIGVKNRKRNDDDSVTDDQKNMVAKNVTLSGSGVQTIDLDVS